MASDTLASYRLVYFQPDPEDGERVCVALLFTVQGDVELLSYPDFPRLKCLAPYVDSDLVRVYLDDLTAHLKWKSSDIDSLLRRQSPQLVVSEVRKCAWPLSDESRLYLMKRFLGVNRRISEKHAQSKIEKTDQVKEHLKKLLQTTRVRTEEIRENAPSQWVLGEKIPQIKPVAFALRKNNSVILIDGVDLSVLNRGTALARVAKVAHTFWQYRRFKQNRSDGPILKKIGVVLNGKVNPGAAYRDTHDFALHEFSQEADLAVDAARNEDIQRFEQILAEK